MLQHNFKIISNEQVTKKFWHLKLDAGKFVDQIKPGQFVHVRISDQLKPFFRRPFSVLRSEQYLEILCDVVGLGTSILSNKKPGECLDILGPLGNSFTLPKKSIKNIYMIAGGVGVAPFLALTDKLKGKEFNLVLLYGGRTEEQIISTNDFVLNGCNVFISTDDGSLGVKGRVSELFEKINIDTKTTFIYTCGPKPMMASVKKFVAQNDLQAEASLEEVMACGIGACLGCATKTKDGYKTVCCDGPVFDIKNLEF